MVIIPNYNKTSHNDCNQCNATEYWFMLYMSMTLILNIWLFKMIKSITFFVMQIHVIFALPSLVPLSLGALGSCPSRLPLDPPLKGGEVEEREGKTGEGEGEEIRGKGGKGREGRAPPPPIFYCTPSSSFLEICLISGNLNCR